MNTMTETTREMIDALNIKYGYETTQGEWDFYDTPPKDWTGYVITYQIDYIGDRKLEKCKERLMSANAVESCIKKLQDHYYWGVDLEFWENGKQDYKKTRLYEDMFKWKLNMPKYNKSFDSF